MPNTTAIYLLLTNLLDFIHFHSSVSEPKFFHSLPLHFYGFGCDKFILFYAKSSSSSSGGGNTNCPRQKLVMLNK
jgi:hypothetical protein